MKLPSEIENFIFKDLKAIYNPSPSEVETNLNSDDLKNRIYLGTYFPRSFVESYETVKDLFSNKIVQTATKDKKIINLLDIGSGTGGYSMGLIWALIEKFGNKEIVIVSIDGNDIALEYQKKIYEKVFAKKNIHIEQLKLKCSRKDILTKLTNAIEPYDIEYDFITSSKFVNEFYRIGYNNDNKGLYHDLYKFSEDNLKPSGFVILNDVTNDTVSDIYPPKIFMSKILNIETVNYLNEDTAKLRCIIPLSCATWYKLCKFYLRNCFHQKVFSVSHRGKLGDNSNVNYKILTQRRFAHQILGTIVINDCYQVAPRKYCYSAKYAYNCDSPPTGCKISYDAFSLEQKKLVK